MSGAAEAACRASLPGSIDAALRARPAATELPAPYREEISHPAMLQPLVTQGEFYLGPGGAMIRRQTEPTQETTEIGKRIVTVRRGEDKTTVPIPRSLAPLMNVLRAIISGQPIPKNGYTRTLAATATGWTVTLTPRASNGGTVALSGCGDILDALTLKLESGEVRRIMFTD